MGGAGRKEGDTWLLGKFLVIIVAVVSKKTQPIIPSRSGQVRLDQLRSGYSKYTYNIVQFTSY